MPSPSLTDDQIEALADMISCWQTKGFALIGAHALGCHIDLSWRATADLDVAVQVSVDEYPGGLDQLSGWTSDRRIPHRWYSPRGIAVDALPTHADILQEGKLQWPGDDRVLNLVGMRLVNERSELVELVPGVLVRVPPLPVLVVVKMAAYLDRPAERRRDLQDILHVLREYPPVEDDRRYHPEVFDLALSAQRAGPYVLGTEIRELELLPEEDELVTRFLRVLPDDTPALAIMSHELSALARTDEVTVLLDALSLGLSVEPA